MPKIRQLEPHVADLIAAGEVVERPASVVKELVENSIDAGAKQVTVEIQRGGMSFIRVTDDGCGIAPEDAETAFLRHATSKIRDEFDLEAIGTLGFRGEALAAIAAVSQVELLTRQAENPLGVSLLLDGGVPREREEAGGPVGTTMVVRNLFYNTPARLKFMKKDSAEGAAVYSVVQHIALSHPEVALRFLREGKQELQTPGDGKLKSALYAVLGRDAALGFTPVKGGSDQIQVEGFVTLPACCRGTRGYQNFFVNGRYVKSRTMTAALEEAYRNQKMVGKFPGCALHISVRLNGVDVNVHPTKTEVKFTSEKALFDGVYYAVKDALEGDGTRPQMELQKPHEAKETPQPVQKPISAAKSAAHREGTPFSSSYPGKQNYFQTMTAAEYRRQVREQEKNGQSSVSAFGAASSFQKEPLETPEKPTVGAHSVRPPTEEAPTVGAIHESPSAQNEALLPEKQPITDAQSDLPLPSGEVADRREAGEGSCADDDKSFTLRDVGPAPYTLTPPQPSDALKREETLEPPEFQKEPEKPEAPEEIPWRVVGELFHTYIVVEQGDKALLIDKHAAHERMNFDRLKARDYRPMAQQLLTPLVLRPQRQEGQALLEHAALLEEFGFDLEDFGDGAVLVRQIPYDIEPGQAEATLTELAGKLLTTGRLDPAGARDDLLHTIACKAAIKGGWKSDPLELKKVAQAVVSDQVRYCPHGRPVAIELTQKQLEKQFKRS